MKKIRIFYDMEKEANWLCEMEKQGYALKNKKMLYEFNEEPAKNRVYQVVFSDKETPKVSADWTLVCAYENRYYYESENENAEVHDYHESHKKRYLYLRRFTASMSCFTLLFSTRRLAQLFSNVTDYSFRMFTFSGYFQHYEVFSPKMGDYFKAGLTVFMELLLTFYFPIALLFCIFALIKLKGLTKKDAL